MENFGGWGLGMRAGIGKVWYTSPSRWYGCGVDRCGVPDRQIGKSSGGVRFESWARVRSLSHGPGTKFPIDPHIDVRELSIDEVSGHLLSFSC
jgi:hypothetical protein